MTPQTLDDAIAELTAAYLNGNRERIAAAEVEVDRLDVRPAPASLHSAALWYAQQGFRVFPLAPFTKIPLIPKAAGGRGCLDGTTDADQINAWWKVTPQANIGVSTGTLVDVIDIDGSLGQKSRCDNWQEFEELDVVAKVLTPRAGGMHLYVPAAGVGNKAGLLSGIDYRGEGGYVVAPPSVTPDGSYRFLEPLQVERLSSLAAA